MYQENKAPIIVQFFLQRLLMLIVKLKKNIITENPRNLDRKIRENVLLLFVVAETGQAEDAAYSVPVIHLPQQHSRKVHSIQRGQTFS